MDRRIKAAIEIIRHNTYRPLELTELARQVNLSPWHFSRLFKAETSVSPGQYASRWRLQQVKELLDGTFLKVNEIAARFGYKHANDLSRAFTKYYGYPPSVSRTEIKHKKVKCLGLDLVDIQKIRQLMGNKSSRRLVNVFNPRHVS